MPIAGMYSPTAEFLYLTPEGKSLDIPPATMLNPSVGSMGKGGSAVNTNYTLSIHSNNAWVSHHEISTAVDGTQSYSYEIRILEKPAGKWKLVAQSIHVYKPEEKPAVAN